MSARVGLFIQARSNSERLPGKIYAGLPEPGDVALILHLYRRLSRVAGVDVVRLLVPESDAALWDFCRAHGVDAFGGSELDVRERYRQAAVHFGVDLVVRATGDNPFTDPLVAAQTIEELKASGADLLSFHNLPLGVAVEAFRTEALLRESADERPEYREHVSLHIKHNPESFVVLHPEHELTVSGSPLPRVTVDTPADLSVVRRLYRELGPQADTRALLELWRKRPDLFAANAHVEQRVFPKLARQSRPVRAVPQLAALGRARAQT